jgi:hypothetical protein
MYVGGTSVTSTTFGSREIQDTVSNVKNWRRRFKVLNFKYNTSRADSISARRTALYSLYSQLERLDAGSGPQHLTKNPTTREVSQTHCSRENSASGDNRRTLYTARATHRGAVVGATQYLTYCFAFKSNKIATRVAGKCLSYGLRTGQR